MLKEKLQENGFIKLPKPELIEPLNALRQEIYSVFNTVSVGNGLHHIACDQDIINLYKINQPLQFQIVKLLWGSPQLMNIGGNPSILKTLQELGFQRPLLEVQPLLRCDMAIEKQSIFEQHQDYSYNIGSSNSVTIWIPLQDTTEAEGALLIAAKSHLKGVYPNKMGIITEDYQFDLSPCEVQLGEILIFNQKLVHQSGRNRSNKIRFSIQLRFSDVADQEYLKRGCPINHKVTTESYAGDVTYSGAEIVSS